MKPVSFPVNAKNIKMFCCHTGHQEVSRFCTRGESEKSNDCKRKHTSKGSTLALIPRADVTTSPKQGYQWLHKKTNVFKKNYQKILGMLTRRARLCFIHTAVLNIKRLV